jgi:hypothetical protein
VTYWQIEKWRTYQHYTDRQPPWVKFHVKFLDDGDLAGQRRDTRLVAALLLLVAARTENQIPDNPRIVAGWMNLPTRTVAQSMKELEKIGYISFRNETEAEARMAQQGQNRLFDASNVYADDASARARPRTRGETETEEQDLPSSGFSSKPARDPAPPPTALPINTNGLTTLEKLIHEAGGDPSSAGVIRAAAEGKPEAVIATARESLTGRRTRQPPLQNPAGYVVNAIRKIAAEHRPPPPDDF